MDFPEFRVVWLPIFILTPIVEMYLLIEVGGYLGALPTIALVMLTAVIGVAVLRRQGLETLARGFRRLDEGRLPAGEVAEGLLLAVAGALLLTPGFVTDTIGFLLLVPGLRSRIAARLLTRVSVHAFAGARGANHAASPSAARVIDGEFHRVDPVSGRRPEDSPPD